jgi:hypothetical protein
MRGGGFQLHKLRNFRANFLDLARLKENKVCLKMAVLAVSYYDRKTAETPDQGR